MHTHLPMPHICSPELPLSFFHPPCVTDPPLHAAPARPPGMPFAQILERVAALQRQAAALQRQWEQRLAAFGDVATVPVTAVSGPPLTRAQEELVAGWAEAAGAPPQKPAYAWPTAPAWKIA